MNTSSTKNRSLFVSARSKAEYDKMFSLTDSELSMEILDCAAGAASFTAEARVEGRKVWAVDPLYRLSENERKVSVEEGFKRATNNISSNMGDYCWGFPASPEEHYKLRRQSADRFLKDISEHPEYYINGTLESLPFKSDQFDISVCSHLLFTYADIISETTHIAYIDEMLRVSRLFIRIYPIVGFGVDAKRTLDAVTNHIEKSGKQWTIKKVAYKFYKPAEHILEVKK